MTAPWTAESDHLRLTVRLTPKASSDAIDGVKRLSDGSLVLAARVRSVPESGRANAALAKLIAVALGVPAGAVDVTVGQKGRVKQLRISGDGRTLMDLAARLWPIEDD